MDYAKILRDNMRDIMRQRGETQTHLSQVTGITEATISRYLSGVHCPRIDYVAIMAGALHVSVDYLLGLSTSTIPDEPPTEEVRTIISSYNRASAHAKKMVWMQLEEYMTDEEKGLAPVQSDEQKSEAM